MARKKISQTEAWSLFHQAKRFKEADRLRHNSYRADYPDGIYIASIALSAVGYATVQTARRLGFALVGTTSNNNELMIYALDNK